MTREKEKVATPVELSNQNTFVEKKRMSRKGRQRLKEKKIEREKRQSGR